jgi:hypothetical protein
VTNSHDPIADECKRLIERCAVLTGRDFSDPDAKHFSDDPEDPQSIAGLVGRAKRAIEELVKQIHRCCSDEKWTSYQKRVACEQLVELAVKSTANMCRLAKEFREPFREIAEEQPEFPCLFPAHAEDLPSLKMMMWDELNLGKRFSLKLRASRGRKTFSKKTWANRLLIDLIGVMRELARIERECDPGDKYESMFKEVVYHVPLAPENLKKWLDAIWEALLLEIPNPENYPPLRQLVARPSLRTKRMRRDGTVGEKTQAHNIRAAIKAKLGVYLKRMLNDSAVHK